MLLFLLYFLIHTPVNLGLLLTKKMCGASKATGEKLEQCMMLFGDTLKNEKNPSAHTFQTHRVTHFPKTKQTFWALSFKDCRQSINDLNKNRGVFLLEKDKCELIFTTKWLVLYFSSTTHGDHLMMAMGAISLLRMSPSQLPPKKF